MVCVCLMVFMLHFSPISLYPISILPYLLMHPLHSHIMHSKHGPQAHLGSTYHILMGYTCITHYIILNITHTPSPPIVSFELSPHMPYISHPCKCIINYTFQWYVHSMLQAHPTPYNTCSHCIQHQIHAWGTWDCAHTCTQTYRTYHTTHFTYTAIALLKFKVSDTCVVGVIVSQLQGSGVQCVGEIRGGFGGDGTCISVGDVFLQLGMFWCVVMCSMGMGNFLWSCVYIRVTLFYKNNHTYLNCIP